MAKPVEASTETTPASLLAQLTETPLMTAPFWSLTWAENCTVSSMAANVAWLGDTDTLAGSGAGADDESPHAAATPHAATAKVAQTGVGGHCVLWRSFLFMKRRWGSMESGARRGKRHTRRRPGSGSVRKAVLPGLCAVALALLPSCEQGGDGLRVVFTTTAGNADRAFVDAPDSLVMLLGRPPHGLAYPVTARVSDAGDIYVADFGNVVVRRFDADGDFVRDYGTGQGEGPGEFQSLVDVEVDGMGRVAGLDPVLSRVVVFDETGGVVETITIPVPAHRFAYMTNGDLVVTTMDSVLFRRFSADGSAVLGFGELLEKEQRANALAISGEFAVADDWVVYTGTYGGVLASWSALDGSTRYIRPTVVKRPFPVPVRRGDAILIAPEDRIAASFALHVDGDRVFVLASADGSRVADVYEAATGDYRHSFHVPDQEATGITVSGDRYLFMTDTLVSVWEHRRSRE